MGVVEIFAVFFFTIGALYCWPTARAGAWVMRGVARAQGWAGEVEPKKVRRAVFWSLMAHVLVSAGMDAITGTSQSLLYLIPTLDKPACAPNCFSYTPRSDYRSPIQSLGSYYAIVVGPTLGHWLMYGVWQLPGIAAAALVLKGMCPWEIRGASQLVGVAAVAVISVLIGLAVVMPLFVGFLIAAITSA